MPTSPEERAKKTAYMREYRARTPDYWAKQRAWKAANKEHVAAYQRDYNRSRSWGLSPDDVDEMIEAQGGLCPPCGKKLSKPDAVDHDHATGRIRGIIHTGCNVALGRLGDSVEGLERALDYLRNS